MNKINGIFFSKQLGFTLIELIITLALSSVVTLAMMNIFLLNQNIFSILEAKNESQETGRIAIHYLRKSIYQAGYHIKQNDLVPFNPPCDNNLKYCSLDRKTIPGDRIAIKRFLDNGKSCAGTNIKESKNIIVVDSFWIDNLTTLYCQTFDAITGKPVRTRGSSRMSKQPLANGVIAMHILYGISNKQANNHNISQYISASEISDLDDEDSLLTWQQVKAVKIGLITESFVDMKQPQQPTQYLLLDANPLVFNDRKSRSLFSTTITLIQY